MFYHVEIGPDRSDGLSVVHLKFGEPANNDVIVPAAVEAIRGLALPGGKGVLFNGPASIPVAMALAHEVSHIYQIVAVFDPKLARYVVAISHSPGFSVGDLIE